MGIIAGRGLNCAIAIVLASCAAAADAENGAKAGVARAGSGDDAPMPTGVILNGRHIEQAVLVWRDGGGLWLLQSDSERLGLVGGSADDRQINGDRFVSLDSFPGVRSELVEGGTVLRIDANASAFGAARLAERHERQPVSAIAPAVFADYDMSVLFEKGRTLLSGVIETGLSGKWGVASSSALVASQGKRFIRLDSAVRMDFPERRLQLLVGDTLTRGSSWSQPVRIGGVRFGTDLTLDPAFVAMATPTLSGSTSLPSTIDLLSEAGNRAYEVGPGQFQLDYLPQISGAGEVTMIVRDIAGTERRVTRRFYTGGDVLQPGLTEFSLEFGALRTGYGQSSFGYGPPTLSGFWRRGLASWATVSLQGAISGNVRTAGSEAALRIGHFAIATVAVAGSVAPQGNGVLARVQVQRLTSAYSLTASYQRASECFRQIGTHDSPMAQTTELAIAGGLSLPRAGSLNASLVELRRGNDRQRLASVSYAQNLGSAYLSLGLRQARFTTTRDTSAFAALTVPLGNRSHASWSADNRSVSASFDHSAPTGEGFGYRALAGFDRQRKASWFEAGTSLHSAAGQTDVTIVSRGGSFAARLLLQGGLVASESVVALTPRIAQGMALVEVSSDSPVPIAVESRDTARSARTGHPAIVTGLIPYWANRVAIDVDALPLNEVVNSDEQIAVPGWRQLARVRFGGAARHPVRIRLLGEDGQIVPSGLRVDHPRGTTIVGHDGEVFLDDAASAGTLRVSGPNYSCEAHLPDRLGDDDLSRPRALKCSTATQKVDL